MALGLIWERLPHLSVLVTTDCPWWLIVTSLTTSVVLITYLTTLARASLAVRFGRKDGAVPPLAPYMVPFVAHTFSFATDSRGFLTRTMQVVTNPRPLVHELTRQQQLLRQHAIPNQLGI